MNIDLTPLYPVAVTVFLSVLSYAAARLSAYLDEQKKFSTVSRISMGISTVTGNYRRELQANPGAPADMVRTLQARVIKDGVDYMQTRYADTFKTSALSDTDRKMLEATLAAMIAGAIGNQAPPAVVAEVPIVADAAVSMMPPSMAADPPAPSPLSEAVASPDLTFGPRADAT